MEDVSLDHANPHRKKSINNWATCRKSQQLARLLSQHRSTGQPIIRQLVDLFHFYLDNLKDGQGVGLGVVLVTAVGGGGDAGRSALFAAGMGS